MMHPHKIDSYYAVKMLIYTDNEKTPAYILNDALFPAQNLAWETYSFVGNAQDIFPQMTALQILPNNAPNTTDTAKYPRLFIAPDKDHAPALGPSDILFGRATGLLIDGQTGTPDKTRACLARLFDFAEPTPQTQTHAPLKVAEHEPPLMGPNARPATPYFEYTGHVEHN